MQLRRYFDRHNAAGFPFVIVKEPFVFDIEISNLFSKTALNSG
jgi:hypothetical protein